MTQKRNCNRDQRRWTDYNGVVAPQLFNDTLQIGKTVIDGYQLHFSQVGDTYTLSSVTNASNDTVLSNLETLEKSGMGKPAGNPDIFSQITSGRWMVSNMTTRILC